jgi:hypothetical protein
VIVRPVDPNDAFDVYVSFDIRPNLTHHDYMESVPKKDLSHLEEYESFESLAPEVKEELLYTVTVPNYMTTENGTYWVGVKLKSEWQIELSLVASRCAVHLVRFTPLFSAELASMFSAE